MDHDETLELIEIASVEPGGLDRLMAGDTTDAALVASHLAGCPACVAEMAAIRQTSEIAREIVRSEPDPALRERTLAFVRAVGRDRSAEAEPGEQPAAHPAVRSPRLGWLAAAAAILLVVGALGFAAGGRLQAAPDGQAGELAVVRDAVTTAMRVGGQPDVTTIALVPSAGGAARGSLNFSPSTGDLVVVATGLADPPAGAEYACWVAVGGEWRRLGEMYPGGGLQMWSGTADGLANLPPGTAFGVSLMPAGGGPGEPVLAGSL